MEISEQEFSTKSVGERFAVLAASRHGWVMIGALTAFMAAIAMIAFEYNSLRVRERVAIAQAIQTEEKLAGITKLAQSIKATLETLQEPLRRSLIRYCGTRC